jgi:ADP-ribose pyrophosphatase YjhB (NUDIX family)
MMGASGQEGRVVRVDRCHLTVAPGGWEFAERNRRAIEEHWRRRCRENPGFFNGTVYALRDGRLEQGAFDGRLIAVDFMSFLYWKETGYGDGAIRDCFGSALIRSAEGHVLLGRQRAGNLNAGLSYLPGGFIDPRDVDSDGMIDIATSVAREAAEETGLDHGLLARRPGFFVTFAGPMISIAIEFAASLPAAELLACVRQHIAADPVSELEDVVLVERLEQLEGLPMPLFARLLVPCVLKAGSNSSDRGR